MTRINKPWIRSRWRYNDADMTCQTLSTNKNRRLRRLTNRNERGLFKRDIFSRTSSLFVSVPPQACLLCATEYSKPMHGASLLFAVGVEQARHLSALHFQRHCTVYCACVELLACCKQYHTTTSSYSKQTTIRLRVDKKTGSTSVMSLHFKRVRVHKGVKPHAPTSDPTSACMTCQRRAARTCLKTSCFRKPSRRLGE